jgi:hypothetical protein
MHPLVERWKELDWQRIKCDRHIADLDDALAKLDEIAASIDLSTVGHRAPNRDARCKSSTS